MQELITGLAILLAALFMLRRIRRAISGGARCGCGSPSGCSGGCPRCQGNAARH
ncbi:MAG: hypothetical protein J1E80_06920 [Desulfovibrionaceae bacterium]|nr:hypothetical protein [Desulfovibrionaceae bacterium]